MKTGQVFIVTTGEYSDFGIFSKLRALRDFSFDDTLASWTIEHKDRIEEYSYREGDFITHLIESHLVEECEIQEVHLADYGTFVPGCARDSTSASPVKP